MGEYLSRIRQPKQKLSVSKCIINTLLVLALGAGLGILSKWLDGSPDLPGFMGILDLTNFFSRMAVWLVAAVSIAAFSNSAGRAAVNVFSFFAGMVSAYYVYSEFVSGFFPYSYAMIWIGLTLVSPLLAAVTWYAKGDGWIATVVSGLIIGGLAWSAVYVDLTYISITSALDLAMVVAGIVVLRRSSAHEFLVMLGTGILTLLVLQGIMPFPLG